MHSDWVQDLKSLGLTTNYKQNCPMKLKRFLQPRSFIVLEYLNNCIMPL